MEFLRPPAPSFFRDSFFNQIGKLVRFQPEVPFTLNPNLLRNIIQGAGFDPDNLSQYGRPDEGWCLESLAQEVRQLGQGLSQDIAPSLQQLDPHQWVLTGKGLAEACRLSPLPPTPKEFLPYLLQVLGQAVKFKSGCFVKGADITDTVILKMGFDPDTLSTLGNPDLGWRMSEGPGSYGFRFRVRYAFKGGWYECSGAPLTMRGPNRGDWGLTEAGVEQARQLCGVPRRNMTANFLEARLKATKGLEGHLWRTLQAAVASKLPISAATGMIDDHIHNCMVRLISRDSLRERILAGKTIPDSLLATYVIRSSFTDIRDMATNPITREMFGARTERERKTGTSPGPIKDPRIIWTKDADGLATIGDIAGDPLGVGGVQDLDEWEDFQKYMSCVEKILKKKKPRASDRYLGILRMRVSGFTISEIAEEEGVTTYRAASMVAEARRCLRDARQKGALLFAQPNA